MSQFFIIQIISREILINKKKIVLKFNNLILRHWNNVENEIRECEYKYWNLFLKIK